MPSPGRPPKPTNLLKLTGAIRKNPGRYRARAEEPKSAPIGEPPAKFMIFHPDVGFQRAEKLRAIWDNCLRMWPWIEFADRDMLEYYCELKLKKDQRENLSGAEITAMLRICSEFGGTGSGRARRGMRSQQPAAPAKNADPRAAYLARKRA